MTVVTYRYIPKGRRAVWNAFLLNLVFMGLSFIMLIGGAPLWLVGGVWVNALMAIMVYGQKTAVLIVPDGRDNGRKH